MNRPCFLVVDREFPGSISTRKLVIETAKFNVITAYSGVEALQTIARFPRVDGIVMDSAIEDVVCSDLIGSLKEAAPGIPVIVIQSAASPHCEGADHYISSFDPASLLEILTGIVPARAEQVGRLDELSEREQG